MTTPAQHRNRLAQEKSPYLLQHQHNPVDWYPWGEAAFAKARSEHKPIFLSIGYSTCHWCHVMERESFDNPTIAALLNEQFVSIKVDREERPDVDKIYMTFAQATTGQGGWPLNVFLTPDLKPFLAGTYFPPDPRHGRPSFGQVLRQVGQLWRNRGAEVVRSAEDLHAQLRAHTQQPSAADSLLSPELLHHAARQFKAENDPQHGGFGRAPKFPRPSQPAFLLAYGTRFGDMEAVRMVLHTCERMAAGGIHDQLGGGFARYAVDAAWQVPHFEKMLYDNAQLASLYLDAYLASGDDRFADIARNIFRYVERDLTHPDGGFYSAEDADSEGHEGKFYCWTEAECAELLTAEEFQVACRYFGLTERGNFVDHSHPRPLPSQNVLSVASSQLNPAEQMLLASAKARLMAARQRRVRPHRDDKVLTSWNGLMLGALSRAAIVLGDDSYRAAAERNLEFLKTRLWDAASGRLYHRWRDGERDAVQLLDAYAFLLDGVLELYAATLEPAHLELAVRLGETMLAQFYDRERGGFWQSASPSPDLILRMKEDYDGAEPSGNSVAVLACLKLSAITGQVECRQAAEGTLRWAAQRLHQMPQALPHLLLGLAYWLEEPRRVIISGDPSDARTRALLRSAHSVYQPHKAVLGNRGAVDALARAISPPTEARAYLCTGTECRPPIDDPAELRRQLR
jgi:hypothetical protein